MVRIRKTCSVCGKIYLGTALSKYCDMCWPIVHHEQVMEAQRRYYEKIKAARPERVNTCVNCGATFHGTAASRYCEDCKKKVEQEKRRVYNSTYRNKKKTQKQPQKAQKTIVNAPDPAAPQLDGVKALLKEAEMLKASLERENRKLLGLKRKLIAQKVLQYLRARLTAAEAEGLHVYCRKMKIKAYPLPCGRCDACGSCKHNPKRVSYYDREAYEC